MIENSSDFNTIVQNTYMCWKLILKIRQQLVVSDSLNMADHFDAFLNDFLWVIYFLNVASVLAWAIIAAWSTLFWNVRTEAVQTF